MMRVQHFFRLGGSLSPHMGDGGRLYYNMVRKNILLLLFALVAVCAGADGVGDYVKMSSYVRQMAATHGKVLSRAKAVEQTVPTTAVFLCIKGDADSLLEANGCKLYDRRGDIAIASVPLNRLSALSRCENVLRIEASRSCKLTMDTTTTVVNALPVYEGTSLPQAYTGSGVVLGIMDVGFDLTNPNFLDATTGESRILAFWDQLSRDTVGSTLVVGRDYVTPADIAAKQHSADGLIQSHGTHTLGIAAGNGFGTKYRGMAFDSDICAVSNAVNSSAPVIDSTQLYKYTSAVDALGFKYIFDYATSVSKPCVATFSEGYSLGEDSEDSLYQAYLATLTGPGRIIVSSAGNESINNDYLHKAVGRNSAGAFVNNDDNNVSYYVKADAPFSLLLLRYGDTVDTLTVESSSCSQDSTVVFPFQAASATDTYEVSVSRYPSTFTVGDTIYIVSIQRNASSIGYDVPLALAVRGVEADVSVRCVSSSGRFVDNDIDVKWCDGEATHNVLVPGCFESIVTVGATIHRTGFNNYQGQHVTFSQEGRTDGVWAYYSSVGPAVGGIIKPDVVAPGTNVVSSYSSFYIEGSPSASDIDWLTAKYDYNGRTYGWAANSGTSMSTPVVAGAIALWLQAKPTLTPADVKDIIAHTARQPEDDKDYPNNYYGYGEIDVYRGLLRVLGLDGIKEISAEPLQGMKINVEADGSLQLHFDGMPTRPFTVSVYSLDGVKVYSREFSPTGAMAYTIPSIAVAGIYAVQVTSKERGSMGSTIVRIKN